MYFLPTAAIITEWHDEMAYMTWTKYPRAYIMIEKTGG